MDHCAALLFTVSPRRPYRRLSASASFLHASVITPRTRRGLVLIHSRRSTSFPLPFFFLLELETSQAEQSRRRSPHRSPLATRLDPSRPNLPSLAPHLLHPSTSSIEPFPRPNRARDRRPPLIASPELHPRSSIFPLRPSSVQSESTVSIPMSHSCSPTLFPLAPGTAVAGMQPRRRG